MQHRIVTLYMRHDTRYMRHGSSLKIHTYAKLKLLNFFFDLEVAKRNGVLVVFLEHGEELNAMFPYLHFEVFMQV